MDVERKIPQSRIRFTNLAAGKNHIKQRGISNEVQHTELEILKQ